MSGDLIARILVRQKPWMRVGPVLFGAVLIHLSLGTYHTFGKHLYILLQLFIRFNHLKALTIDIIVDL